MVSKKYHRVFLVRFLIYFTILSGLTATVFQLGPVMQAEIAYRYHNIFSIKYILPAQVVTSTGVEEEIPSPTPAQATGGFANLLGSEENIIKPVSTDFGIVIEKINANALIIPDVDPASEKSYTQALQKGVALTKGSTLPGENGNMFLFSHSVDAPWNIARYNAVFYLLRELEKGDRIIVFYQGRRYDYIVFDKTIAKPQDISFLTNLYDKPVLTMQTCDPPGTLINRLIVRARLQNS